MLYIPLHPSFAKLAHECACSTTNMSPFWISVSDSTISPHSVSASTFFTSFFPFCRFVIFPLPSLFACLRGQACLRGYASPHDFESLIERKISFSHFSTYDLFFVLLAECREHLELSKRDRFADMLGFFLQFFYQPVDDV